MSATEIIEQIAALPEREQAIVIDFVATLRRTSAAPAEEPATIEAAGTKVFDRYEELFRKLAQ